MYIFYGLPTILQIQSKKEKYNMVRFEPASSCYKHHYSIYYLTTILFHN